MRLEKDAVFGRKVSAENALASSEDLALSYFIIRKLSSQRFA